ncbi:MAG: L,D-transpeptidase family protein [Aristaeellaceae bacterium]
MRKLFSALLFLLFLPVLALSEAAWTQVPDIIRPGKTIRLTAAVQQSFTAAVLDASGSVAALLAQDVLPQDGTASLYWDGLDAGGDFLPEGTYTLRLTSGADTADAVVRIGPPAPVIVDLLADDTCSDDWTATVETSTSGTLTVTLHTSDGDDVTIIRQDCTAGYVDLSWDGTLNDTPLSNGVYELTFRLLDATGFSSSPEVLDVTVHRPSLATDVTYHTPNEDSPITCDHDVCYWKLNMGEMDEAAIWQVLTQPVTVLKGGQREQVKVRREPDKACTDYVGEVTCASQAVHILDQQGDWTLIEAYSSSASGSKVKVWAQKFQGWVDSSLLMEQEVDQEYGIVVDKLQQRLYLFKDGHLFSTLMCSTGFPTKSDPFNETPAGEFLIVSWTGGFWSEDIYCDYALRINGGILLHEVPCYPVFDTDGKMTDKNYANFESYLGEKASHGCIRIQRRKTPEGVNMRWLWDNLNRKSRTKVMIWDEVGRVLGYPDDDVLLYYNPNGGRYYHSSPVCAEVNEKYWPLTAFRYGELEDAGFAKLSRCKACAPQLRTSAIDALNEENTRN